MNFNKKLPHNNAWIASEIATCLANAIQCSSLRTDAEFLMSDVKAWTWLKRKAMLNKLVSRFMKVGSFKCFSTINKKVGSMVASNSIYKATIRITLFSVIPWFWIKILLLIIEAVNLILPRNQVRNELICLIIIKRSLQSRWFQEGTWKRLHWDRITLKQYKTNRIIWN